MTNPSDEIAGACILVFDSIHHVLAAERALQAAAVWCDLTPTPRSIRSDCGMVIAFRPPDLLAVQAAIRGLSVPPRAAFRLRAEAFEVISLDR